ncbi:unnamed protein product [Euphydryas editha]|uniref:AB hydrolase-1 domain-containing protein n=1 Tax=Euphydryas editha TaxID=104508 RepID=A0AAU9TZM0_EUPED|nr:unnamed protein product [Euphydryas editha]
MSSVTFYRFIRANVKTLLGVIQALVFIFVTIVKNPFKNPWVTKLKLEPPAELTDPKYGVHKYIKANNIKLHYVESGDPSKPLMLFLHGYPEFWYSWRHQIVHFKKDYRVVAVDMRGYGDSEKPEDIFAYKMEYLVEDIKDLIRALGHDKCILVAHDWGGIVACKLRELHPEIVHALIMLASASLDVLFRQIYTTSEQEKRSGYVFLFRAPKIPELLLQMNDLQFLEKIMLVKGKDTINDQDIECYKYWLRKQSGLTPPINYYRANILYTWEEKFFEEKVPFLFAFAENDKYLNKSILDVMKTRYATIETIVVDDCRHFLQQEEPEKVNKLMRDFLAKNNL